MYLKSLSLRGFKSFADKTTMLFDPGLTVVVGPNGSGKSNISDAILWVLGEQSAKMLRGSAMEDVIFSGSSARQSVSMAEVTLVLDNSDGVLPVEFSEVAVTRRVYRSGESEYLINNSPCRLMDVVDILHDSGLGREMHSIISQGNLDSILSSRPEERRELIEEAAGISKHRRRKIRSERRLKSMDENLTRAKDINKEIQRQLRPLERQVGKAREARQISERLRELTLALAVDELRGLQQRHAELSAKARECDASIALAKLRHEQKTSELERYQSLLEEKGIFVGDLGQQRSRLQEQLSRMEAETRLLGQKGHNMSSRIADLESSAQAASRDMRQAQEELERVSTELGDARAKWNELKRQVDELVPQAREAKSLRKELNRKLAQAQADQRSAQREADQETLAHAKLQDQVSNAQVEDELFRSRLAQIEEQLKTCEDRIVERGARKEQLTRELEEAQSQAREASERIQRMQEGLKVARKEEQEARELLSRQRASLKALESVDEQAERSSPLIAALMRSDEVRSRVGCRLADLLNVPPEFEGLVEGFLGEDLSALVVSDAGSADAVAHCAAGIRKSNGRATVLRYDEGSADVPDDAPGTSLLSLLSIPQGAQGLLGALLGGVRIVGSTKEALAAHATCPSGTFVTREHTVVYPDGRLVLGSGSGAEAGALERKRRIRLLRDGMESLESNHREAQARVGTCERDLQASRDANARAKGDAARLKGELSSVDSEMGRLRAQLNSSTSEKERVQRQRADAASKAQDARSAIERHREAAQEATARAMELADLVESLNDQRSEASRTEAETERRVSDARLRLATVQERKNNLIVREDDLRTRVARLSKTAQKASEDVADLKGKLRRVKPLQRQLDAIMGRAKEWQARLEDRASLAEADSESLKKTIGDARAATNEAQAQLERARQEDASIKVELGKVEVKVQTAVSAIEQMGEDLAQVLSIPAPEDREAARAEAAELKRRLSSIGPVNEVAVEEYTRLKQRADYIAEQVQDLESARKSLAKITAAIDRKMRRQFLVVYDQVNANFTEVFSLLFPGGQAHLELTDPDHLDQTGIEVVAQPRGKKIQKMMLMSGGEKSLTALALLFAVYRTRTVPFYVFDEVEAALDDSNLGKLLDAIDELRKTTQLIVISHQRRTMENADVLYGVSMQADGVSHVVSQRLDHTGRMVKA
ncbi:MAG: chromosome segregation protein SMC [Coriobacteriales bacterium]|nr:chromosome segregation protein SMC [Coriobacteriales bacterium]